jgi:hypothetical protein
MPHANSIAQHFTEKFGMVTVLDAVLYEVGTNKPLIHFDTLKVSNISVEGSQKEIRGGQGAELLLTYDYGRTANVEITDALASMYSLEYLWGGKLATDEFEYNGVAKARLNTDGEIPAGTMPAGATLNHYYIEGAATLADGTYTPSTGNAGKSITLYYTAEATPGAHVHQLTLTSTDFPKVMRLVGNTFLLDQSSGKKVPMQIEIPRFKLATNFSFTLEAEGDASVFDFSGVALSDNGDIMHLRTFGEV